jgi:hypothetical protein
MLLLQTHMSIHSTWQFWLRRAGDSGLCSSETPVGRRLWGRRLRVEAVSKIKLRARGGGYLPQIPLPHPCLSLSPHCLLLQNRPKAPPPPVPWIPPLPPAISTRKVLGPFPTARSTPWMPAKALPFLCMGNPRFVEVLVFASYSMVAFLPAAMLVPSNI